MKKAIRSVLLVGLFLIPALFAATASAEPVWFCTYFPNPYPPYTGLVEICFWVDIP